jgi:hypothetical protein
MVCGIWVPQCLAVKPEQRLSAEKLLLHDFLKVMG